MRVFHLVTHVWCKMHKVCENMYNTRVGEQRPTTHQTYPLFLRYYHNLHLYYPICWAYTPSSHPPRRNIYFPITIGIGHVRYKFQGRLSKKKICKSPSMLRSPRACNNKRTCQGKVPDDFHSLAPQHFIPNKYPPSVWGYLKNRDL